MKRLFLFALPLSLMAQKPEVVMKDMVRDVGVLQDQVGQMQKEVAEMKAMLQQVLDQAKANGTAMAKMDSMFRDRLSEQQKMVAAPVSTLGSKVDAMTDEFRFVKESIAALSERMGKLDQKVTDTNNAIRVLQAPPAPPAGAAGGSAGPPPGVSAASLFKDAARDKSTGNFDLALEEYNNYLKWFGTTDDAPLAEYYTGEIYYNQKSYEQALKAFDAVLEKYPRNPKTLDAMYMKGQSLVKLGQRDDAVEVFREIIKVAPSSDQAGRARQELRALGMSTSTTAPAGRKKR